MIHTFLIIVVIVLKNKYHYQITLSKKIKKITGIVITAQHPAAIYAALQAAAGLRARPEEVLLGQNRGFSGQGPMEKVLWTKYYITIVYNHAENTPW